MDQLLFDASSSSSHSEDAHEVPQGGLLKPEAEINRFTVDEHLSDVERVNLFLSGGEEVQQRKAIEGIPALLKSRGRAGWEAVRENLLLALKQLDADAQVSAAEGLRATLQQHLLPTADAVACLLPLALSCVKGGKDKAEEETEAWLLLLLELVPVVGPQQLLEQVLPLALSHGQVNETVASRVVCCRLLGAMTAHLPPADVTSRFVSQLMAACQDTDYQVRIAAAQQLPVLAQVLGPSATLGQLLPELAELLTDDEVQVRMSALNCLVSLCELLPREARVAHLLPLVRGHMQPLELEAPLQRTLAAAFPRLLAAVHEDLEPSDAGLMYSCFRHLAARTNVDLRRTCAACVSELVAVPLPGSSPSYLYDTWADLAVDHDEQVRAAIASQLHVMAQRVPQADAARLLRRPLAALLRDSNAQVREALLTGLADTLQALSSVDDLHREGLASDMHQGLLVLQGNIAGSWRCQQHLAAALPHLPVLLAPEVLGEHWVPYAFSLLLNGAAAVRPAAARGLASLLRGCRRERPRTELYCRVMRELAWGRSCFARLAFIQLCLAALAVFSCRWFKEHLLLVVMELLADAVPNVRLAALGLLPALKQTIRLPEDVQQLEQLNSAMSNLMTDNDRDVAHAARSLHATFKRTPLRMTGGAGMLDINGASSGAAVAEFEAADRSKEDGEADLTLTPEDVDRLNAEWAAVSAERKGRRNPMLALSDSSGSGSGGYLAGRPVGSSKGTGVAGGGSGTAGSSRGATASSGSAGYGGSCSSSSSSSSSAMAGQFLASGRTAAATAGAATAAGWASAAASAGTAYDRRYGSGTASSSSSPAGSGLSIRTAAGFGSMARAAGTRTAGAGGSLGSPRPGASSSSSGPAGGGLGFGPGSSPVPSPTGSSLLAHMRLPVLAASSKPGTGSITASGGGSSGSFAQAAGGGSSSSALGAAGSSSQAALSGSRMGWSSGGLGSLSTAPSSSAAAAASGGRQPPLGSSLQGSLAASTAAGSSAARQPGVGGSAGSSSSSSSMFGRAAGDAKGKPGALQSKAGAALFGASGSSKAGLAGSSGSRGGAAGGATGSPQQASSRDAAARRFR